MLKSKIYLAGNSDIQNESILQCDVTVGTNPMLFTFFKCEENLFEVNTSEPLLQSKA